jgi:SAM-dependent methyltransferase
MLVTIFLGVTKVTDDLQETIQFWDEFAEEYAEIQSESQITIAEDVAQFMVERQILPTNTFVDIAGGHGRYVSAIIHFVQDYVLVDFSKEMIRLAKATNLFKNFDTLTLSQEDFILQPLPQSYDIVFTAMNPSLTDKKTFNKLLDRAANYFCILRMIEEQDDVFSPFEKTEKDHLMDMYKSWLETPYESILFSYKKEESVSRSFFKDYFRDDYSEEKLNDMLNNTFGSYNEKINQTKITFELLLVPKERNEEK